MPRMITEEQRSLCIELIPQMMSGELSKAEVRERTKLTDGAINSFRNIAKFHSYDLLVKTKGKYKEEVYDLLQTCNLVELAYATGLLDAHIFCLSRKVIQNFRTLVEYRRDLGHPLIKGVSVQSFIPNEANKMQAAAWSTWNADAIDELVIKSKGASLRETLLAHEEKLRSDTKEHEYLDIKSVSGLKQYGQVITKKEVQPDFYTNKNYQDWVVAAFKDNPKFNAVEFARNVDKKEGEVRNDKRFMAIHGADEFLKCDKRKYPKRYEREDIKSILCLMHTFKLSQEFVALLYKCDRGEFRRVMVDKEIKEEGFVPFFPNIPPSTNISIFINEIKKSRGLSDPYDILETFYNENGVDIPPYHKRNNLSNFLSKYAGSEKLDAAEGLFCPKTALEHPFYVGTIDHVTREKTSIDDLIVSFSCDQIDRTVQLEPAPSICGKAKRMSAMTKLVKDKGPKRNKEVYNYIQEQKLLLEKCGPLPDEFNYKKKRKALQKASTSCLQSVGYPSISVGFDSKAPTPEINVTRAPIAVISHSDNRDGYEVVYNTCITIDCDAGAYFPYLKLAFEQFEASTFSMSGADIPHDINLSGNGMSVPVPTVEVAKGYGSACKTAEGNDSSDDIVRDDEVLATDHGDEQIIEATLYSAEEAESEIEFMFKASMLDKQLSLGICPVNELNVVGCDHVFLKKAFMKIMGHNLGIDAEEFLTKHVGKRGRPPIINPFSHRYNELPLKIKDANDKHFNTATATYFLAKQRVAMLPQRMPYQYAGDYSCELVKSYQHFMEEMKKNGTPINTNVARHVFNVSAGKEVYMNNRDREALPTYRDNDLLRKAVAVVNGDLDKNYGSYRMAEYLDFFHGMHFNHCTVRKAMRAVGVAYKMMNRKDSKYSSYNTDYDRCLLVPNYVDRDFKPTDEWQLIATDITAVDTPYGKQYVQFWQDAFSSVIRNTIISPLETVETVLRGQAEIIRMAPKDCRCVATSDRGHQYLHPSYCKAFDESDNFMRSQSGLGRCLDGAKIESLNGRYKEEVIARIPYAERTPERIQKETIAWVESYNFDRPNSNCFGMPPMVYSKRLELQRQKMKSASMQS